MDNGLLRIFRLHGLSDLLVVDVHVHNERILRLLVTDCLLPVALHACQATHRLLTDFTGDDLVVHVRRLCSIRVVEEHAHLLHHSVFVDRLVPE